MKVSLYSAFSICLLSLVAGLRTEPCSVLSFGAVGDNRTEDTGAIQQAVNECTTVVFPAPGVYLSRSVYLNMHDELTLVIEPGATLIAWGDIDTWNSTDPTCCAAFLYAVTGRPGVSGHTPLRNLTLTGGGTIDGQGWRWWPFLKTRPRPILFQIDWAIDMVVSNISFLNSPSFHLAVRGDGMRITHVNISAGNCSGWLEAPNTDGINIGGTDIYIADSTIRNGDDCIPTNANWNGSNSYNILVERVTCECGTNGGVAIGYGNTTLRDIMYRDMVVSGTNQGAGMKISEAYENVTATFQNITWQNITIVQPRNAAVYGDMFVEDATGGCPIPNNSSRWHWLSAYNVSFVDITAIINSSAGALGGCFSCSPLRPCQDIAFNNVTITDVGTAHAAKYVCHNAQVTEEGSSPVPCSPA